MLFIYFAAILSPALSVNGYSISEVNDNLLSIFRNANKENNNDAPKHLLDDHSKTLSLFNRNFERNNNLMVNSDKNTKQRELLNGQLKSKYVSNILSEPGNKIENSIILIKASDPNLLESSISPATPAARRNEVAIQDRKVKKEKKVRARKKKKKNMSNADSSESDERMITPSWKEEWKKKWIMQKEAYGNKSTTERGDVVNMAAARPWGIPCGDPNQHDMPWGSCMLSLECESEYRIYRGDHFCGRTEFVCCALQLHTYDMYEAVDLDLESDNSDSGTKTHESKKKSDRRKKKKERRRRKRNRRRRKKQMKIKIKKLIRAMQRNLKRISKNSTQIFKEKQKAMKKKLELEKKKEREARKIQQKKWLSEEQKMEDKMFQQMESQFKDISNFGGALNAGRRGNKARSIKKPRRIPDYLDYDVEYGLLYL